MKGFFSLAALLQIYIMPFLRPVDELPIFVPELPIYGSAHCSPVTEPETGPDRNSPGPRNLLPRPRPDMLLAGYRPKRTAGMHRPVGCETPAFSALSILSPFAAPVTFAARTEQLPYSGTEASRAAVFPSPRTFFR